jgi:hypothetical protein
MSASTETFDSLGWSPRRMDALPLIDEPLTDERDASSFHRMHWVAAAVAQAPSAGRAIRCRRLHPAMEPA